MFIVSNGAFKSGSTWLHKVTETLVSAKPIPQEFQNPRWMHQSVEPALFERFLSERDVASVDYLSKNHIRDGELRALLLAHEHVRVLNITRDLRDVLVSAYFHDRREGRIDGDIDDYWAGLGKRRIAQIVEHHRLWNTGHSQVYVTSYEALKSSFDAQVEALAAFLEIEQVDASQVRRATDFDRMRGNSNATAPDQFHRKGIVGDWRNHLSDQTLSELAEASATIGTTNA